MLYFLISLQSKEDAKIVSGHSLHRALKPTKWIEWMHSGQRWVNLEMVLKNWKTKAYGNYLHSDREDCWKPRACRLGSEILRIKLELPVMELLSGLSVRY